MKFSREWAMSSPWTFQIKPIKELLERYVLDGNGWVDPFSGMSEVAEHRNDIRKNTTATSNLLATDFLQQFEAGSFKGGLLDPPYSNRQISEHYKEAGIKCTALDTSGRFYSSVKNALAPLIIPRGIVISFGWNSCGMGIKRGFEIVEIMLVSHGSAKNDTIVTVEQKL